MMLMGMGWNYSLSDELSFAIPSFSFCNKGPPPQLDIRTMGVGVVCSLKMLKKQKQTNRKTFCLCSTLRCFDSLGLEHLSGEALFLKHLRWFSFEEPECRTKALGVNL